jgi:beta-galactosidase
MNRAIKLFLGIAVLAGMGVVFKDPLLSSAKPYVNKFMMSFPESDYLDEELPGSYASIACQNSHVDWGESIRTTQSLDGQWDVEQGELSDLAPKEFSHKVNVPGFITEANPGFELVGMESDEREAFWYRKTFTAPSEEKAQALLCLSKAKYGVKVWLNGTPVGEHFGAFSLSEYKLSSAIRYGQENELIVRIGSEHNKIPEFIPAGADFEKYGWYPGLWDSVSVVYTGEYSIVRTKVDADIDRSLARVHSTLRNNSSNTVELTVSQSLKEWKSGKNLTDSAEEKVNINAGETITLVQEVTVNDMELWTPETPFLYSLHTRLRVDGVASDDRVTRFGMRKVEWRAGKDKGFYLNNELYYLRGTNLALHRFFEDQDRKQLPWNESWVRELLSGHMKDFHWNSFRFHVGRAPNFWYDLADEVGFVVTDEYHIFAPVRLGIPGLPTSVNWSLRELEKEFTAWVQENWNHASIGWWDASNENHNPLPYEAVPLVRNLDPTRAWESGSYRAPDQPNDPLEEHPYKLNGTGFMNSNDKNYLLSDLDNFTRLPPMTKGIIFRTYDGEGARNHPYINNEYGWLWLTRDGSDATPIAETAYELMAPGIELSSEERREIYAYVVSELSGYWRARRSYAGVQHFLHLGKCTDKDTIPEDWDIKEPSATCDNFIDIPNLTIEPRWQTWAPHAFAPVGLNLEKWDETFYQSGKEVSIPVDVFNDTRDIRNLTLNIVVADKGGNVIASSLKRLVTLSPLESLNVSLKLKLPDDKQFVVYAYLDGDVINGTVISRRKIGFLHPGIDTVLPSFLTQAKAVAAQ